MFAATFGSQTLPTVDNYGFALVPKNAPTMANVTPRGYVLSISGISGFNVTSFDIGASYTKMAWVNYTNSACGGNIMSTGTANGRAIHYFWLSNGSWVGAGHSANGAVNAYVSDPTSITTNTWYHFAVTYNNSTNTMTLYRNGTQVATTTNAALAWSGGGGALSIGLFQNGNGSIGYIDNARVFSGALTSAQVQSIYNAESAGGNW